MRRVRPRLPVILATGYADDAMRRRWSGDSFVEMLHKPFQPHDLEAALARVGLRLRRPD
jgi:CheY-like chemotaxis protein